MTEQENKLYLAIPLYNKVYRKAPDKLELYGKSNERYIVIAPNEKSAQISAEDYLRSKGIRPRTMGLSELTKGKDVPLELRVEILQEATHITIIKSDT